MLRAGLSNLSHLVNLLAPLMHVSVVVMLFDFFASVISVAVSGVRI